MAISAPTATRCGCDAKVSPVKPYGLRPQFVPHYAKDLSGGTRSRRKTSIEQFECSEEGGRPGHTDSWALSPNSEFIVTDDAEQKLGGSAEAPPHKALNWRLAPAPLVRIENLAKVYRSGEKDLVIFHDLALQVEAGEQFAIIGESGAGKSTLLHLISGLDKPSTGAIYYKNRNIIGLPEPELSDFRNREIGYVWQQHHLLPEFSAEENVSMPLRIRGESGAKSSAEARASLAEVGLANRAGHRAGELSGGEQQRIAIARALTANPSLLLADEPTGNLDEGTGQMIFNLLDEIRKRRNLTTILVTHNLQFARRCDRILKLENGSLEVF